MTGTSQSPHHVGTLVVEGTDPGERRVVVVRSVDSRVALNVSLESNGDAEVMMRPEECQKLVALLEDAIKSIEPPSPAPARLDAVASGRSQGSATNELPGVRYASGEEVRTGDAVTYFGNPGQVQFVADPRSPTPETEWHLEEFGSGAMVLDSKIGPIFLSPDRDLEHLVFVGRKE